MAGGRPTKYNDVIKDRICALAERGLSEEQIGLIVGISDVTLRTWKKRHQEFLLALQGSKAIADEMVVASLFSRAIGYSHPEVKVFCHEGVVTEHIIEKHYPPCPVSMQFWLRNRQPEMWGESANPKVSEIKITIDKDDEKL